MTRKYTPSGIRRLGAIILTLSILFSTAVLKTVNAQTTVTIGAGSQSGTQSNGATGDCGPMYRSTATSTFVYSRHHYLYTATELATAGIPAGNNITKLAWNDALPTGTNSPCIFQIWIKNSSLTDVGAGGQAWATLIGTSTQVYNNSAHTVPAVTGWHEITLTTPFLYTGGALEISVNFDISAGTSPWTTAGFSWFKDPITGRTLSYVGSAAPGLTLPNLRTVRAQIQMTYVAAGGCTSPPTPGSATATPSSGLCVGNNIGLNLSGNSTGSGQTYQWQSSATGGGVGFTNLGSSQTSSLLNTPATSSLFYRCEVTCSGNTQVSSEVQVTVNPPLPAGTYTINSAMITGGANYQTFADAATALSCGIAGPVTFNVDPASGPYTEQVTIPSIGGSSATNTITINGNGRTLQFTPVTTARHVLKLDGADNVTIDNLLIKGLATDFDWGIHLMNGADNNTISNCEIDLNANTSTTQSNSTGIVASNSTTSTITLGNNANNLTVTGCTIKGGYAGIVLYGNTGSLNAVNNIITNNTIQDFYLAGVQLNNNDGALVEGNDIHRTNRVTVTTFEGVTLGTTNINVVVNANRIHDTHNSATTQSGNAYGIYLTGCDATVGNENRITNNLIYNFNSLTGIQYGLYNSSSNGVYYYHNTVVLDHAPSTAGNTYAFHQLTLADNIQVVNNLLYVTRGGTGLKNCLRFATTTSTIISNNNILYINAVGGTSGIGFYSINYPSLTGVGGWQTANGNAYDQQSISVDPVFVSPGTGNYTPSSLLADNIGVSVGVTTDILNASRSLTTPDAGAYEFSISAGLDVGAFELITPGTTGCYSDLQTVVIRIKNYGGVADFSVTPVTITCNITGAATATLTGSPTGTLAVNGTMDVLLTGTFDMSTNGTYTFNAYTTGAGDGNANNDTMIAETRTRAAIVAGTVSANTITYCLSGAPVLTLTGSSGGDIQWQESTISATGPWTNVGTGTSTYTPGTTTQTTYYQVVISCLLASDTTNVVTVTVNNPMILTTQDSTRCGDGSVQLGATSTPGSTPFWFANPTGGTSLASGNIFNTPVISTTTTYYAEPVVGGGGSDSVAVPIGSGGTTGVYHHMFLVSSPTGLTVNGFGIKCNMTIGALSSWDIYYRPDNYQLIPGSNLSSAGWTLLSTVANVPSLGATDYTIIASGLSIAIPAAATYSFYVAPAAGTTHQYGTSAAGTVVTTNTNASIIAGHRGSALFNLTTASGFPVVKLLYALGCVGTRVPVTATINPAPGITASGTSTVICSGFSTILSASSINDPNYVYTWIPGNLVGATVSVLPIGTTTYTVTALDTSGGTFGGCNAIATVTISTMPVAVSIDGSPEAICGASGSSVLTLDPSTGYTGGSIQWQSSPNGIVYIDLGGQNGATYTTPVISSTTWYRAIIMDGNGDTCQMPVKQMVVGEPTINSTTDSSRCGYGTVPLLATSSAGSTINWYANPTGGTSIATGSPFITPPLSASTTFYVQAETGGGAQGVTPMPTELSAFSGNVRGYSFTAPVSFTLTGIECLSTAAGNQHVAVVKFVPPVQPPAFSASTNAFNTLFLSQNNANLGVIPCNIQINAGDVIGILGQKGTTSSYANPAGPYTTTIAGQSVVLTRMLMQFPLGTTAPMNLSTEATGSIGRVALTYEIGCTSARVPVIATVNPGPEIDADATSPAVCTGGSTTVFVSSSNDPDYIYSWISNPAGFTASGPGPHTVFPSVTTTYIATAIDNSGNANNGCGAIDSVTVTTGIISPGTIATSQSTLCLSGTPTIAATGSSGLRQWQQTTDTINGPWINVGTGGTTFTPSLPVTQTTYYRLVVSCDLTSLMSNIVTVEVISPVVTSSTTDTLCGSGIALLSATASAGATLNWYANPTGGTPIVTGNTYTTPTISSTTNYYVSAIQGGASGNVGPLTPQAVGTVSSTTLTNHFAIFDVLSPTTINTVDIFPTAAIGSTYNIIIQNSSLTQIFATGSFTNTVTGGTTKQTVTLNATLPTGTGYRIGLLTNAGLNRNTTGAVYPYTLPGVISLTGNTFNVVYYYFFYNWSVGTGCESARTVVTATVTPAPAINVTSVDPAVCAGGSTTIQVSSLNDPGYSYSWTSNPAGFTNTGSGPFIVSPVATTTYYVNAVDTSGGVNSGCVISDSVTVITGPALIAGTASVSDNAFCVTGNPTLTLTGSAGGFIQWQESTVSVTGPWTDAATGATYSPTISQTTYFQAVVKCPGDSVVSNALTVTVTTPLVTGTTGDSRCGYGPVDLLASGSGLQLNWYDQPSGGNHLGTGSPFTPTVNSTTTFYVTTQQNPFSTISTGFTGGTTATDPNAAGNMFNIHALNELTINGFEINLNDDALLAPSNISIYYKSGTYIGSATTPGAWTLAGSATGVVSAGAGLPTNLPITLNLTIPAGATYGFYIVVTNLGTSNSLIYNNSATSPAEGAVSVADANLEVIGGTVVFGPFTGLPTAPVNRMWNGNVIYSIGCESARSPVVATVTPPPALTLSLMTVVCNYDVATLSVTSNTNDFDTYVWSPTTNLFQDLACTMPYTGQNLSTVYLKSDIPVDTTTYTCIANDTVSICGNIATVDVAVQGLSNVVASASQGSICLGTTDTLSVSIGTGTTSGVNVGLIAVVTSSGGGTTAAGYGPELLNNNLIPACDIGSITFNWGWVNTNGWYLYTWATPQSIKKVVFYKSNRPFSTLNIETSNDGVIFTPVQTGVLGTATCTAGVVYSSVDSFTFVTPITTRYLRFNNIAGTNPNFREIQVFSPATSGPGLSYTWNPGNLTGQSVVVTPPSVGLNDYTVAVYDSSTGCTTIDTVTIDVVAIPATPLATASTQCGFGVPVASVSGGGGVYSWYLSPTGGAALIGENGSSLTSYAINTSTTFYVSESNGTCSSFRAAVQANVTQPDAITAAAASTFCQNADLTLSATQTGSNNVYTSYSWTALPVSGSGIPTSVTGNPVTIQPTASGSYTYLVMATDTVSDCVAIDTIVVNVVSAPVITSIQASPNLICGGATPVTLTALTGTSVPGVAGIGTQTTTIGGTNGNPYRTGNGVGNQVHTQLLVLASELTSGGLSAGNLTSLGFTTTGAAGTVINFTIKIGNTGLSTLTTSFEYTPMTTVFTQATFSPVLGLNTHIFSTPFIWDGSSNIIIDVCQQNSVLGTTTVAAYTPGYASNLHIGAVGGCSAITGTAVANKPTMQIGGSFGTSGPGSYQWQWSPGLFPAGNVATTTPTLTTTYTVTATAPGTGCITTDSILVNVTQVPHPYFQEGDSVLCSNDVGFEMHILDTGAYAGGYPPGTIINFYGAGAILYQNGTSTSFFNANNSDAFYAVVTLPGALGGCDGISDTSVIDFGTSQAPQYVLSTDSVKCYGGATGSAIVDIVFGGTPDFRYQWYDSGMNNLLRDVTKTGLNDSLQNVPAGMYIVVITDHQGATVLPNCSVMDSVFVGEPLAPLAVTENIASHVDVLCNGELTGALGIDVTGGTESYTYNWSNGATTEDLTGIGAGGYTVTVTDARGCTVTMSITLTQGAPIVLTITGNTSFCAGSSTLLNAGTGFNNYEWSTGATTQTVSVNTAETFTVTVTDGNGCTATASVTTIVNANPVPSINGLSLACASTPLDAGAGHSSYAWSNGATTQVVNVNSSGTYTVTVTNANGCTGTASKTISIVSSVPAKPGVIFGPSSVCKNSNVTFSIAAVPGATSYTWTAASGATVSTGQGSTTVVVNFSSTATSSALSVVANNICGSGAARTFAYTVSSIIPSAPVTITGQFYGLCNKTNVAYNCPAVVNATSYLWTVPAGAIILSGQGTNSITVKYNASFTGTGILSVVAQSGCGNSAALSRTVNAKPAQPVISGQNWACKNQPGLVYSVAPVFGATSYTWTVVAGSILVSGQGTTSIVVNWGSINGVITCKANNGCGSSLVANKPVSFTCKEEGSMFDFSEINLFPNPASASATIQFDGYTEGSGHLFVYDLIGKQLLQEDLNVISGNNQYTINLSTYPKGSYIVKVIYNGYTRNCKLVVK